jgi:hypothetical protein
MASDAATLQVSAGSSGGAAGSASQQRSGSPSQHSSGEGSGSGSETRVDSEGWPLGIGGRRRRRPSHIEREQFNHARQDAVQDAMMEVNSVYYTTMLLGFIVIAIATFFEVKSVYVLVLTYGEPCDRPLWYWLCGHIVLGMLRELSWQPLKGILLFIHVVWTFFGFMWFSKATTCRSSSPELYNWVQVILMIASIFLAATTLLPLTFYITVMVLVILVNRGVISNQKAAREGTLEKLEVIEYNPELFAPPNSPDDPRPAGECCCCTETFDNVTPVVRTPCQHYYHKECIGDWLKLARTCPLCRCDLEEAVWNPSTTA